MARDRRTLDDIPVPSDPAVEKDVVILAAANEASLAEMRSLVGPDSFLTPALRGAWETLCSMHDKGERIDYVTYPPRLDRSLSQEVAMGMAVRAGEPDEAVAHARTLADITARRELYLAACEMLRKADDPATTAVEAVAAAVSASDRMTSGRGITKDVSLDSALEEYARTVEDLAKGRSDCVTTGVSLLDSELRGGMTPGQLIVLAARPSVGKTALMLQMAVLAAKSGRKAAIYSLEMTMRELAERYVLSTGLVDAYALSTGNVDWEMFGKAQDVFSGLPLTIDDSSRSLEDITASLTLKAGKGECDCAYIDYLGYIQTAGADREPLAQKLGRITGSLKATARKLGIPIVLLCQLNRESVKENRSPQIYDLRDSGAIEQDADVVLMLHRTAALTGEQQLTLYARKNRKGRTDFGIRLHPNQTYTYFTEGGFVQ